MCQTNGECFGGNLFNSQNNPNSFSIILSMRSRKFRDELFKLSQPVSVELGFELGAV